MHFTVRLRQMGTASYDRAPPGTASYGVASPGGFRHFAYGFARRILHPTAWLRQEGSGISLSGLAGGCIMLWDKFLPAVQVCRFPGFIDRELHPTAWLRREGSGISLTGFARRILHPTAWLRREGSGISLTASPGEYCILRRGFAKWVQAFH